MPYMQAEVLAAALPGLQQTSWSSNVVPKRTTGGPKALEDWALLLESMWKEGLLA